MYNYYEIESSFYETKKDREQHIETREEFIKHILEGDKPMYEVIRDGTVRVYFDIEGIPENNDKLIYEIIDELNNFAHFDCTPTITENKHSHHEGRSYHVYFPCRIQLYSLQNLVWLFIEQDYKKFDWKKRYYAYIDHTVYNNRRLFRVVGRRNCDYSMKDKAFPDDIHKLIQGTIEDTIIQHPPSELRMITEFDNVKVNKNNIYNIKGDTCIPPSGNLIYKYHDEMCEMYEQMNKKIDDMKNMITNNTQQQIPTNNSNLTLELVNDKLNNLTDQVSSLTKLLNDIVHHL